MECNALGGRLDLRLMSLGSFEKRKWSNSLRIGVPQTLPVIAKKK